MAQMADVRASDADRARVLDDLARHTTAGRLNMDEYSERVNAVYRASTLAELAAISADLPPQPDSPAAPRIRPSHPGCPDPARRRGGTVRTGHHGSPRPDARRCGLPLVMTLGSAHAIIYYVGT